jgi:membrane-associated protease RseP (regulator of RpoE activity)
MQKQLWRPLGLALLLALFLTTWQTSGLHAEEESPTEPGLVIVAVDSDGPAAAAGVVRGDILLAIDETEVNTVEDLATLLTTLEAGATITLRIQHGDELRELQVETAQQGQRAYLGVLPYSGPDMLMPRIRIFGPQIVRPAVPPRAEAVQSQIVVMDVLADSAAEEAGLQVNDVLVAMNGEPITDLSALQANLATLEAGDTITLTVERADEETVDIALLLGENEQGKAQIGVKLGIIATINVDVDAMPVTPEHSFQWLPALPQRDAQFWFWRYGPGPHEPNFLRFHRSPPSIFYFAPPGAEGEQHWDFWQSEDEMVLAYPYHPERPTMDAPPTFEFQPELMPAMPSEEESVPYY